MFYVWLFTSGFLILSILTQFSTLWAGIIPNFMNIIMTLALEITTASLMIKKINSPHKTSYSLKAVGMWIFYYGLFMLCTFNREKIPQMIVSRIELSLVLIALGCLIYYYNRKALQLPAIAEVKEVKEPDPPTREEKLFDLVFEIESLLSMNSVLANLKFSQDLEAIERYIQEIQKKNIDISNTFLDQVTEIYQKYGSLSREELPPEELGETLNRVEEVTRQIKGAFEMIHHQALMQDVQELDYQITALSNQLRLNGLVESDFEIEKNVEKVEE